MATTDKERDYMGRLLQTPDTDARDFIGRDTSSTADYMGRGLVDDGGGDPAQTLLDEAAVRFDFSEYDDIDAMVDVNGGWGPLVPGFTGVTTSEFTADGLHIAGNPATIDPSLLLEAVGPLVFGPDGMTILVATIVNAAHVTDNRAVVGYQIVANVAGDYAPAVFNSWLVNTPDEILTLTLQDGPPNTNNLAGPQDFQLPTSDDAAVGLYVYAVVVDTDLAELRIRGVNPAGTFDESEPFAYSPADFVAAPAAAELLELYYTGNSVADFTSVEWLAWNRVLTTPELDALFAHFA